MAPNQRLYRPEPHTKRPSAYSLNTRGSRTLTRCLGLLFFLCVCPRFILIWWRQSSSARALIILGSVAMPTPTAERQHNSAHVIRARHSDWTTLSCEEDWRGCEWTKSALVRVKIERCGYVFFVQQVFFFFFHFSVLSDAADAPHRCLDRGRRVWRSVVVGYVRRKYCQQWLRWWGKSNAALEARASAFRTCALSGIQGVYLVPSRVIHTCYTARSVK